MSKSTVVDVTPIRVAPFDPATLTGFHLLTGDAMALLAQVEELVGRAQNLEAELHGLHPTDPADDAGYYMVRDLSGCSAMWCAISAISSVARGLITADLFRTTPTSGVPGWLVSPGDLVSTAHGQGVVVTVFEFPIVAVEDAA